MGFLGAFFLNQKFCYGYLLRKMGKFTNLINDLPKCNSYATDCRSIHLGIDSKDPFPYAQVQQAQVLTLNCRVRSCVVNAFFAVGNNNLNVKKKHMSFHFRQRGSVHGGFFSRTSGYFS